MTTANTHSKLNKSLQTPISLTTQITQSQNQPNSLSVELKRLVYQSPLSNKQAIEIVLRMSSKYGLFLLVVLLRVTKVSKELRINLCH